MRPHRRQPTRLRHPWDSPRQEHWSGLPFPSPMHEREKWKWSRSFVSDSLRPHGLQPTRLLCPWDFPGKSTGVGCHCLLQMVGIDSLKTAFFFFCSNSLWSITFKNWYEIYFSLYDSASYNILVLEITSSWVCLICCLNLKNFKAFCWTFQCLLIVFWIRTLWDTINMFSWSCTANIHSQYSLSSMLNVC